MPLEHKHSVGFWKSFKCDLALEKTQQYFSIEKKIRNKFHAIEIIANDQTKWKQSTFATVDQWLFDFEICSFERRREK